MKKIRYGVVGLGHIAQIAVLPAFKHAKKSSELTALVTGTRKKALAVSKKYKVKDVRGYDEFDDLLGSGNVDALYIALPNRLHHYYACRALEQGIHVLCEKPLALSQLDCREMLAAAKRGNAKLMTAYRLHFDRPTQECIQFCRSGKLGNLKTFVSSFSYVIKDKNNIRLDPADGGGPIWDIGIYCINAARSLFGHNPVEVFAYSTRQPTGPFSKVDETVSVVLRFSDERTALFTCSFGATASSYFEISGDKGKLHLENAYEYAFPPTMRLTIKDKTRVKKFKKVDQFAAELDYFSNCVLKDLSIETSGEEGLTDVAVIEAIIESARSERAVTVHYGRTHKEARPVAGMVNVKPPVNKPNLVAVKSASGD